MRDARVEVGKGGKDGKHFGDREREICHEALAGIRDCLTVVDDRGEGFEESKEFEGFKEFDLVGELGEADSLPPGIFIPWPRPCEEKMMPVRIEVITMDCRDERRLSACWTGAPGYDVAVDQPGDWMVLQDPSGTGPSIRLQVVPETKVVKNRVHLDLIPTEGELETEVRQLENLGARRVRDVEHDPDESHWIMADPEGHECCGVRPLWDPRPLELER